MTKTTRTIRVQRIDGHILTAEIPTTKPLVHASDCAVNNMPAMPAGKCDCGAVLAAAIRAARRL